MDSEVQTLFHSTPPFSPVADRIAALVSGKRCTVLGYGISNRPLCTWLMTHGVASLTVRDRRTREQLAADGDLARLTALGATVICGEDYLAAIDADLIFRTPGLRPDVPELVRAVEAGATLTSEMELFLDLTPTSVIAISGSDGKTTTTTLTSLLVEAAARRRGEGSAYLGGNIGTPLLSKVEEMTERDSAVVELSSFQLMTITPAHIDRVALTNVTPNHLNWHTDMAEYAAAKARLLAVDGVHPKLAVLNADNDYTRAMGASCLCPVVWFSGAYDLPAAWMPEGFSAARGDAVVFDCGGVIVSRVGDTLTPLLDISRIRLPGRHNVENYMTAIALTCVPVGDLAPVAAPADVAAVAATFTGVRHRLEIVREWRGVRYVNSSIDSSPTRTEAALHALHAVDEHARDPIIICGGRDKNTDFAPLADALSRMASAVVLTGETRDKILAALRASPLFDPDKLPVTVIPDYREAMQAALRMAKNGDTVLLSPACTSFDAFRNFEERGDVFCEMVRALD